MKAGILANDEVEDLVENAKFIADIGHAVLVFSILKFKITKPSELYNPFKRYTTHHSFRPKFGTYPVYLKYYR